MKVKNWVVTHSSRICFPFHLQFFFQFQPSIAKLMTNLLKFVNERKIPTKEDQSVKQRNTFV